MDGSIALELFGCALITCDCLPSAKAENIMSLRGCIYRYFLAFLQVFLLLNVGLNADFFAFLSV